MTKRLGTELRWTNDLIKFAIWLRTGVMLLLLLSAHLQLQLAITCEQDSET